jgi:hypothetical protein
VSGDGLLSILSVSGQSFFDLGGDQIKNLKALFG